MLSIHIKKYWNYFISTAKRTFLTDTIRLCNKTEKCFAVGGILRSTKYFCQICVDFQIKFVGVSVIYFDFYFADQLTRSLPWQRFLANSPHMLHLTFYAQIFNTYYVLQPSRVQVSRTFLTMWQHLEIIWYLKWMFKFIELILKKLKE